MSKRNCNFFSLLILVVFQSSLLSQVNADSAKFQHALDNCYKYFTKNLDSTEKYSKICLLNISAVKKQTKISGTYFFLADVEENKGNFDKAFEFYLKGKEVAKLYKDTGNVIVLTNSMGRVIAKSGDFKKALPFFLEAENLGILSKNRKELTQTYNNLVLSYSTLNDEEKLFEYSKKSAEIAELKRDKAIVWLDLSYHFLGKKKYNQSVNYLEKAKEFMDTINDLENYHSYENYCAGIEMGYGNYKKALTHSIKSIYLAQKMKSSEKLIDSYSLTADIYIKLQDYKNANYCFLKFSSLKDSVFNLQKNKQIQELNAKYDLTEKQSKIDKLILSNSIKESEINRKNGVILFTIISILLGITLAFFGFKFYKSTQQQLQQKFVTQKIIESEESERKRIAQDLHDGVNQQLAVAKMNIQKKNFETSFNQISDAIAQVRLISRNLHPTHFEKTGLLQSIKNLIQDSFSETEIFVSDEIEDFEINLPLDKQLSIYRILQELTQNILKHSKATSVKFIIQKKSSTIYFSVLDNGIGHNEQLSDGIGLISIKERLKSLNSIPIIKPAISKGFSFSFQIQG